MNADLTPPRFRPGTAPFVVMSTAVAAGLFCVFIYGWAGAGMAVACVAGALLFAYARIATRKHERSLEQRRAQSEARDADASQAERARELRRDFGRCRLTPRLAGQAERALAQLEAARQEQSRFMALLGEKLSPGELTYARWAGAATDFERALGRGFEDLREAMTRSEGAPDDEALRAEIDGRLQANDEGIGNLRQARAALAQISSAPSETDYGTALKELESIAARAKRLAAQQNAQQRISDGNE